MRDEAIKTRSKNPLVALGKWGSELVGFRYDGVHNAKTFFNQNYRNIQTVTQLMATLTMGASGATDTPSATAHGRMVAGGINSSREGFSLLLSKKISQNQAFMIKSAMAMLGQGFYFHGTVIKPLINQHIYPYIEPALGIIDSPALNTIVNPLLTPSTGNPPTVAEVIAATIALTAWSGQFIGNIMQIIDNRVQDKHGNGIISGLPNTKEFPTFRKPPKTTPWRDNVCLKPLSAGFRFGRSHFEQIAGTLLATRGLFVVADGVQRLVQEGSTPTSALTQTASGLLFVAAACILMKMGNTKKRTQLASLKQLQDQGHTR